MKWTHETTRSELGETGDFMGGTTIKNGKLSLYIEDCTLEDEELDKLCELLSAMPELICIELDALEFEKYCDKTL